MTKETSRYKVLLFNEFVNDSDFAFSECIELIHKKGFEVIDYIIEIEETDFYKKELIDVLNIVNKNIDSYIGISEQEIIYKNDTKLNCLLEFNKLFEQQAENKILEIFIELFQKAIVKNKNIYFLF